MVQVLSTKSCNMVLHCRRRVWSRIVIQQQNPRSEKPRPLFPNLSARSRSTSTLLRIGVLRVHLLLRRSPISIKRFFRMQNSGFFLNDVFTQLWPQSTEETYFPTHPRINRTN
ncbi:hypothetical protein TNCV_985771 [Trichonephila clavipes]|uniref:Uncharacterized protein n=1 Tax=Trichonephila clavipes TaxID=2585209 RepID=A0A8X6VNV9_TRICX|nr:hypothetical protein TNCV_985771 [Trichonephila clavipes]